MALELRPERTTKRELCRQEFRYGGFVTGIPETLVEACDERRGAHCDDLAQLGDELGVPRASVSHIGEPSTQIEIHSCAENLVGAGEEAKPRVRTSPVRRRAGWRWWHRDRP